MVKKKEEEEKKRSIICNTEICAERMLVTWLSNSPPASNLLKSGITMTSRGFLSYPSSFRDAFDIPVFSCSHYFTLPAAKFCTYVITMVT